MPARTNAFQRLVALLTRTFAESAIVAESAMLADKATGAMREVDVYVVGAVASFQFRIALEVVSWSRPADVGWIDKMRGKYAHLPIDKLILVSESGFTSEAQAKASFSNVEALTIEQAIETDWPLIAALMEAAVFEKMTLNYAASAVCRMDDGALLERQMVNGSPIGGAGSIDDFMQELIRDVTFRDLFHSEMAGGEERDFWMELPTPGGRLRVAIDGAEGQVVAIRFALKASKASTSVKMEAGKYRSSPFVSGTATDPHSDFKFVLAKNSLGEVQGTLQEGKSIATLSAFEDGKARTGEAKNVG